MTPESRRVSRASPPGWRRRSGPQNGLLDPGHREGHEPAQHQWRKSAQAQLREDGCHEQRNDAKANDLEQPRTNRIDHAAKGREREHRDDPPDMTTSERVADEAANDDRGEPKEHGGRPMPKRTAEIQRIRVVDGEARERCINWSPCEGGDQLCDRNADPDQQHTSPRWSSPCDGHHASEPRPEPAHVRSTVLSRQLLSRRPAADRFSCEAPLRSGRRAAASGSRAGQA